MVEGVVRAAIRSRIGAAQGGVNDLISINGETSQKGGWTSWVLW